MPTAAKLARWRSTISLATQSNINVTMLVLRLHKLNRVESAGNNRFGERLLSIHGLAGKRQIWSDQRKSVGRAFRRRRSNGQSVNDKNPALLLVSRYGPRIAIAVFAIGWTNRPDLKRAN
jgi:hypothetical protein